MQPRADVLIVHARMIIVVICVLLKFPNISSSCHLSSMDSCLVCRHSIVGESFRWSQHCLMMKAQRSLALLWRSALLACDVRHLLEKDCAGDLSYTTRMSYQGVSIIARWIIGRQTSFDSPNTSFESSTAWNGNLRLPEERKDLYSSLRIIAFLSVSCQPPTGTGGSGTCMVAPAACRSAACTVSHGTFV